MKDHEIESLLKEMTRKEKIGQLVQLTGQPFAGTGMETGPKRYGVIPEEMIRNTGSILNVSGAGRLRKVQEEYLKTSPHKIPMLFMADVINGYRTVFPIPLAQGCSFDPELVQKAASISARETAAAGLHLTFSPMVDLVRDARWGRVMESTGEDVYLNCQMAKAMVEGYQGDGAPAPDGAQEMDAENGMRFDSEHVAACVKHFAAYGAPEGGREYNSVDMSERRLREEYLPGYKAAVDAGCAMVMTSFNTVNGVPATGNAWLMKDVLRDEWGFDGVVISDYSAIRELMTHGVAEDEEAAAAMALQATVDIDMVTDIYATKLEKMAEEGAIPDEWITEGARRVLNLKNKLGLLDDPFRGVDVDAEESVMHTEEHQRVSLQLAEESMVLLKNDGILPVALEGKTVALIGPYSDSRNLCGSWSMYYREEEVKTLKEVLEERGISVQQAKGCTTIEKGSSFISFDRREISAQEDEEELLKAAVWAAENSDVVILTLGEDRQQSGEGGARADISLGKNQIRLFQAVKEVNPNVAVVLFNGRPLDITGIMDAPAILDAWFPGTEGAEAVVRLLTGEVNPSGKLSMSIPYCTGQEPIYYSHLMTGRPKVEGEPNRFTSGYLDVPSVPRFSFGYGLSYTEFSYGTVQTDHEVIRKGKPVVVSVEVENTGDMPGTETVQCYVRDMVGSVSRPVKELKGFKRIFLEPGEKKMVEFEIAEEMLRFYNQKLEYRSENGVFRVFGGGNSDVEEFVEVRLEE